MNKRDILQKQFSNEIIKNNFNGVYIIAPRVGKTKITIDSIKGLDWNIIITTPRVDICDSWKYEAVKWNLGYCPKVICNNSLLKIKDEIVDLLIVDECHLLSDNQILIIQKIKPKRILLLTGTLGQGKLQKLKQTFKTDLMVKYTIDNAIEDNIISDYEINIIKVELTPVERDVYTKLTRSFEWCKEQAFLFNKYHRAKMNAARKRMFYIYNIQSKALAVKKFIKDYERCLIFSSTIKTADIICEHSYHSKSMKSKNNLELFKDSKINKLAVCKMSDCGITFPNLKLGIIHQVQSSEELFLQRSLRCCNLDGDKIAKLFVFICKDTVDELWLENCLKDVNRNKIKYLN